MFNNFFFRKSCLLWDKVEKYGRARGTINYVTIWRLPVACWISKATRTHVHEHTHATGLPHARTHTHTHRQICFSTATMFRERASLLRYTPHCYVIRLIVTLYASLLRYTPHCYVIRLIVTLYVHCLSCVIFSVPSIMSIINSISAFVLYAAPRRFGSYR
jgi:hypothetical protein